MARPVPDRQRTLTATILTDDGRTSTRSLMFPSRASAVASFWESPEGRHGTDADGAWTRRNHLDAGKSVEVRYDGYTVTYVLPDKYSDYGN